MHKDEAASGFEILSNPSRVKITKFLYMKGTLSFDDLLYVTGDSEEELKESLQLMEDGCLLTKNGDSYSINKEYVDSLMDFVRTPCGCCH